jgi:hypothetical protein
MVTRALDAGVNRLNASTPNLDSDMMKFKLKPSVREREVKISKSASGLRLRIWTHTNNVPASKATARIVTHVGDIHPRTFPCEI